MGLFNKAKKAATDNADKVEEVVDKAADLIDEKTGGKYSDKLDQAGEKVGEALNKLKDDDAGN